jgi:hypothetical protein
MVKGAERRSTGTDGVTRWLALVLLASVAGSLAASGVPERPLVSESVGPQRQQAPSGGKITAGWDAGTLPFRVAGTILTADLRLAYLIVPGEGGGERALFVREGEMVGNYRITKVDSKFVYLEKGPERFRIGVSNPRPGSPVIRIGEADASADETPGIPAGTESKAVGNPETSSVSVSIVPAPNPNEPLVIPHPEPIEETVSLPPETVEEVRAGMDSFLQALRDNPQFQRKAEQVREQLVKQRPEQQSAQ